MTESPEATQLVAVVEHLENLAAECVARTADESVVAAALARLKLNAVEGANLSAAAYQTADARKRFVDAIDRLRKIAVVADGDPQTRELVRRYVQARGRWDSLRAIFGRDAEAPLVAANSAAAEAGEALAEVDRERSHLHIWQAVLIGCGLIMVVAPASLGVAPGDIGFLSAAGMGVGGGGLFMLMPWAGRLRAQRDRAAEELERRRDRLLVLRGWRKDYEDFSQTPDGQLAAAVEARFPRLGAQ